MLLEKPSEILQESVKNARQEISEIAQKLIDKKSKDILKTSKEVTQGLLVEKSEEILKIINQLSEELGSRNRKFNYMTWAVIFNLLLTALIILVTLFRF